MSSATVSGIAQTLPLLSPGKTNASVQEEKAVNSSAPAVAAAMTVAKDSTPATADTISISPLLRQALDEVKKEDVTKIDTTKANNIDTSSEATAKVQFAYDVKGNLSVRYMDAANKLVYQTPSELMLRMKEDAAKADKSVDTKA